MIELLESAHSLTATGAVGREIAVKSDRISFQFIYAGLSADAVLTPHLSLNGSTYDSYPAGKVTLAAAEPSQGVTLLGLAPAMFVKWTLDSALTAGEVEQIHVIQ